MTQFSDRPKLSWADARGMLEAIVHLGQQLLDSTGDGDGMSDEERRRLAAAQHDANARRGSADDTGAHGSAAGNMGGRGRNGGQFADGDGHNSGATSAHGGFAANNANGSIHNGSDGTVNANNRRPGGSENGSDASRSGMGSDGAFHRSRSGSSADGATDPNADSSASALGQVCLARTLSRNASTASHTVIRRFALTVRIPALGMVSWA